MKLITFLLLLGVIIFNPVQKITVVSGLELADDATYRNILVKIDQRVPEDWQLIEKIKEAFSLASRRLKIATSFHSTSLAFRDVRILVPISWNKSRVDKVSTWESNHQGHFRVSGSSNTTKPNTVQPKECGEDGLFVNLHPSHIANTSADNLGKQLVREFAKLRYGVFNEFNDASGPHSYLHNGEVKPISCSLGIRSDFIDIQTGKKCSIDMESVTLNADCRGFANELQNVSASLMSDASLSSIDQFCESNTSSNILAHNKDAPNPHNIKCAGKSVREVMRLHADFKRSFSISAADPTVNFTVVRPREDDYLIIIMDSSGSMGSEPMAKQKIAVEALLMNYLEDGIYCGMISFNSTADKLRPITKFNSTAVRRDFFSAVKRLVSSGTTAIGDALATGMEMLGADLKNLSKSDTGYIVLLSDGQQNIKTRYNFAEAIELVKQTSIIVYAISFGNAADKRMSDLSRDTGGLTYFSSTSSSDSDLRSIMAKIVAHRTPNITDVPVTIISLPMTPGSTTTVILDSSAAKDGTVTLSSTNPSEMSSSILRVTSPSGIIYGPNNTDVYSRDATSGIISISFPGPMEVGAYRISEIGSLTLRRKRRSTAPSKLTLTVTSKPATDTPLLLSGWINDLKFALNADTQIKVYATLEQGSDFVKGANIRAVVEADSGVAAQIQLRDNGVGADVTKDDGVYTGLVPSTVQTMQEYNVRLICDSPVNRVVTAGKFEIISVDSGSLNRVPPATVQDLQARINLTEQIVTLTWTAVGDKRMEGNASSYKIYACNSSEEVRSSISRNQCELRNLTVIPLAAGSQQELNLTQEEIGNLTSTIFIGLVAVNRDSITSTMSNLVTAQFTAPVNVAQFTVIGAEEEGGGGVTAVVGGGGGGGDGGFTIFLILIGTAVGVIAICVALALILIQRRHKN